MAWALQDAKAKFSEVVDRALTEGQQEVTRHGRPAVVVVAQERFKELIDHAPEKPKISFGQFLLTMPQGGPDGLFERIQTFPRDIDFGDLDE